jgi:hypothetical protein
MNGVYYDSFYSDRYVQSTSKFVNAYKKTLMDVKEKLGALKGTTIEHRLRTYYDAWELDLDEELQD